MRNMWSQSEIIMMGKLLGFKNFDRRSLKWWQSQGLFPDAILGIDRTIQFYPDSKIRIALYDIARRLRPPRMIEDVDIEWAIQKTLETTKSQNITRFIKAIQDRKGLTVCKGCEKEDVRVNKIDGLCFKCHTDKLFTKGKKKKKSMSRDEMTKEILLNGTKLNYAKKGKNNGKKKS